jgi:hypothetical protein
VPLAQRSLPRPYRQGTSVPDKQVATSMTAMPAKGASMPEVGVSPLSVLTIVDLSHSVVLSLLGRSVVWEPPMALMRPQIV